MGTYEDKVRSIIKEQFGSVPKMAGATGIPATTIYHALDRGLDNTTTRTRRMIMDALETHYSMVEVPADRLADDERELIALFDKMDEKHRDMLLETARSFAALGKEVDV